MIDPNTSKNLPRWEPILMAAMIIQYVLYPFTVFMQLGSYDHSLLITEQSMGSVLTATINVEMFIDITWLINMGISIVTAKEIEEGMEERWTVLSKAYMKNEFFFDFVPTLTSLTVRYFPETYLLRILRMKRFGQMRQLFEKMWFNVGVKYDLSKEVVCNLQYFYDFLVILFLSMHSLACAWVFIGFNLFESWGKTWIDDYWGDDRN